MIKVILLIGPSGVGKSDYGQFAEQNIHGCRFFDLDHLVGQEWETPASQMLPEIGDELFRERCEQAVRKIVASESDGIKIVAVGAGALQSTKAGTWISGHVGPSIAVVASPEEVYRRGGARNTNRTFTQFLQTEYSEHRKRIYRKATHCCDVTELSLADARLKFNKLIRQLAAQMGRQAPSCG